MIELEINDCKYNLDNLPSDLKILKIHFADSIPNPKHYYITDDFKNLPVSLEHFVICGKIFKSVDVLIENYDSTIFFLVLMYIYIYIKIEIIIY